MTDDDLGAAFAAGRRPKKMSSAGQELILGPKSVRARKKKYEGNDL
jgi:hypothetical protein